MKRKSFSILLATIALAFTSVINADEPVNISGVYPHLRMWNTSNEAGTGAVVVWQGDLWAITYAPHRPKGSDDKLYRISPDLTQHIFEGSVGGTPANRMIHKESQQLLIGPYLIDAEKNIRVIPPTKMPGRLTGNARHLTSPENMVYYATMEEGLYEVDVKTLEVKNLIKDGHDTGPTGLASKLPGYHGKGLFSGQGRLVYSNNGERSQEALKDPEALSGALAQWFGKGDWELVLREQFTEVTGPGGISGNENPETDPVWSMGWDAKSLLLALLENGEWHFYRLPKGSHSYDGAHGWNTEWPRIREIGEDKFLATMHGTFWDFPSTFSRRNSSGIAPRSNYLKVVGDFCRWDDRLVLGCDDSAAGEFLNTRPFKAEHGAPRQSNSNLWFIAPEDLDSFGPAIGRGSVWLNEDIADGETSLPYLFAGYDHRLLHLSHGNEGAVTFTLEVDKGGTNEWTALKEITVDGGESVFHAFEKSDTGAWIRLRPDKATAAATAHFQYRKEDTRAPENDAMFAGLIPAEQSPALSGVMQSLAYDKLGLVSTSASHPDEYAYYEINSKMEFIPVDDPAAASRLVKNVRQPEGVVSVDEASILLIEDGQRYRLPRNPDYLAEAAETSGKTTADLESVLDKSLSANAKVTVSSEHGEYTAGFATDRKINDSSRWIGKENESSWIELDFGKPQSIASIWVVSGWKNEPAFVATEFDVQTEIDGEWVTVEHGEVRNNRSVEKEIRPDTPVTCRKLRIAARNKALFRIYEIAAFDHVPEIDNHPINGLGPARICREVATERDLLNVHGTVYELPARNAQGLAKVRPVATHNLAIQDFCSHNGLLFFTGLDPETKSEHILRSADGKAAVWAGVIDDLWKLGKPRGLGGPWKNTGVEAGTPSDPYLMTGYDQKSYRIESDTAATIRLEVDVDGTGVWAPYQSFKVEPGTVVEGEFPIEFSAYWVRAVSDTNTNATVQLRYE